MSDRLDVALQAAGLARSRTHARRIVAEGRARIDGRRATKPAAAVPRHARLDVVDVPDGVEFASRASHKLISALEATGIDPRERRCLDAGASTGGFSDVLLRRGAAEVIAVDIGHHQLAAHVRDDPRVRSLDGTSVRDLTPAAVGGVVDLLVADLSFISLHTVIAGLGALVRTGGDLLVMVKPQFEVGRTALPRSGVVSDPDARLEAVTGVARAAAAAGLALRQVRVSGLAGQDGNREYFLRLRRTGATCALDGHGCDMIEDAVRERPHPPRHPQPETHPRWEDEPG